jgi:hypothetical protein
MAPPQASEPLILTVAVTESETVPVAVAVTETATDPDALIDHD